MEYFIGNLFVRAFQQGIICLNWSLLVKDMAYGMSHIRTDLESVTPYQLE